MKLVLIALMGLMITGCKSSGTAGSKAAPKAESEARSSNLEPLYCHEIAKIDELLDSTRFAFTTVLNYKLIEGCACIKYQYSGCSEGESILTWNGKWNENTRPEVMMKLLVTDAGLCEQILTDSTCFSLKEMQLVGNQVLVFLNTEENNLLVDYDQTR